MDSNNANKSKHEISQGLVRVPSEDCRVFGHNETHRMKDYF